MGTGWTITYARALTPTNAQIYGSPDAYSNKSRPQQNMHPNMCTHPSIYITDNLLDLFYSYMRVYIIDKLFEILQRSILYVPYPTGTA